MTACRISFQLRIVFFRFHDSAAAKCKLKLLGPDGNLNIFQEDGSLPEAYENFRTNREPDLETKVFMQLGQKLIDLFNMMRQFFGDDRFAVDKKRACAVFLSDKSIIVKKDGFVNEKRG